MAIPAAAEPVIGERLQLIPFSRQFLTPQYISWLNDSEVTRFSEQRHRIHTLKSCETYYVNMLEQGHFFWAIVLKQAPAIHIGNFTAYIDRSNQIADLAILIGAKQCWGKGFGLEAWNLAEQHLFSRCNIRKITAGTMALNLPMMNIFKQTEMQLEGERLDHFICNDQLVNLVLVAKFNQQI